MQTPTYHGQIGQDMLLDTAVFQGMRDGVFVEAGALDGLKHSNTLMFERDRGWTGLCIEPNPFAFAALQSRRSARCLNIGISDQAGEFDFQIIRDHVEGLSGFLGAPGEKLQRRIDRDLSRHRSRIEVARVETRRLPDVLAGNGISELHYLSLDTQGEEPGILRSLQDDQRIFIHVIDVECNYRSDRAGLVTAAGPAFAPVILHRFDLFLINRSSPFYARRWALRRAVLNWEIGHRIRKLREAIGADRGLDAKG